MVKHKVKKLTYQKYHEALYHNKKHEVTYNFIRSKSHQIYSMSQVKQSLRNYENKRLCIDAFNSLIRPAMEQRTVLCATPMSMSIVFGSGMPVAAGQLCRGM